MTPLEKYYSIKANKVIQSMTKRNIEAYYCQNKADALKKTLELISENSSISWGGSQTIMQIGLIEELKKGNYNLFDRELAKTSDEIDEIYRKAFYCDYYFTSANAITIDGQIINMDGNSNRVAAMMYGPKNVILIAGMNKIESDEQQAIKRVRTIAAPINAIRLNRATPCVTTGNCHNCKEEDCICCNLVITRFSRVKNRIKVILIGEELGY